MEAYTEDPGVDTPDLHFPLSPGTKIPLRGLRWADASPEELAAAWETAPPDANRALRLDNYTVLDFDDLDYYEEVREGLPDSPMKVRTPRGLHVYYQRNLSLRSGPVVPGKLDIKTGPRAYVVVPPSVIDERQYRAN